MSYKRALCFLCKIWQPTLSCKLTGVICTLYRGMLPGEGGAGTRTQQAPAGQGEPTAEGPTAATSSSPATTVLQHQYPTTPARPRPWDEARDRPKMYTSQPAMKRNLGQ